MDPSKPEKMRNLDETEQNGTTCSNKTNVQANSYWSFTIYKSFKISVFKPLIFLKISLLLWMSAASSIGTFFVVFLKQRGFTITDLLLMNTINPILHSCLLLLAAVVVDKLGRSKEILISCVVLAGATMLIFIFLPPVPSSGYEAEVQQMLLYEKNLTRMTFDCPCETNIRHAREISCNLSCLENTYSKHFETSAIEKLGGISIPLIINGSSEDNDLCICSVHLVPSLNMTHTFHDENCTVSCAARSAGVFLNVSMHRNTLVALYIGIAFFSMGAHIFSFRLFDVTSIIMVKEYNAEYGHLRIWTVCGLMIGPTLSAVLIHSTSSQGEQTDLAKIFYMYAALCFSTAIAVCKVNIRVLDPGRDMMKKSLNLIKCPDVVVFLFVNLVIGISWSMDMMYRNWYLDELETEAYMYSLIIIVKCLYGIPFMYHSKWFVKRIGEANLLVAAILSYGVKFYAYSILQQSWPTLLIELTSLFHYHFYWVAVMHFCARISPDGLISTVSSTAGTLHYMYGRICGGFLGAMLMKTYGGRTAFQIMGAVNAFLAILYGIFLYCRRGNMK